MTMNNGTNGHSEPFVAPQIDEISEQQRKRVMRDVDGAQKAVDKWTRTINRTALDALSSNDLRELQQIVATERATARNEPI